MLLAFCPASHLDSLTSCTLVYALVLLLMHTFYQSLKKLPDVQQIQQQV